MLYRKSLAVKWVVASLLPGWLLPVPSFGAPSGGAITIAPNLMVIMSTAPSMNKLLSDTGYPALAAPAASGPGNYQVMNDQSPYVNFFAGNAYANQPGSKLYQAKAALTSLLNNPLTNHINIGFATWRMIFARQMYTATNPYHLTTSTGGVAVQPVDPDIFHASTPVKTDYANDPTHFTSISWGRDSISPERFAAGSACATLNSSQWPFGNTINGLATPGAPLLGKNFCDGGKGVINDSAAQWLTASSPNRYGVPGGGLPAVIQAVASNTAGAPIADEQSSCNQYSGEPTCSTTLATRDGVGVTGSLVSSTTNPPIRHKLCGLAYSSQTNIFTATYYSDVPFPNAYHSFAAENLGDPALEPPPSFAGTPETCASWAGSWLPARTVTMPDGSVFSLNAGQALNAGSTGGVVVGTTWAAPENIAGKTATVSISGLYNGVPGASVAAGTLDGWSGESTYSCTVNGRPSNGGCANPDAPGVKEILGVTYPSGAANPDGPQRKLVSSGFVINRSWARSPQAHMGVFLDLPPPSTGYMDQRATILGFLGLVEMRDDGLDYNPVPQTMAPQSQASTAGAATNGNYGVSAASQAYANGSPIYDSLADAYQYYKAYQAYDPYAGCRNNNVLLMIDGKEDARLWMSGANVSYADPTHMAAALNKDLGVNVYVVIMSTSSGDVAQANAIAKAGGTDTAYSASSASTLFSALSTVFTGLAGQVNTAPVAVPANGTPSGSVIYDTANTISPA